MTSVFMLFIGYEMAEIALKPPAIWLMQTSPANLWLKAVPSAASNLG